MREYFRLFKLFIKTKPVLVLGILVISSGLFLLEPLELIITEKIVNLISINYSEIIKLVIILVIILSFNDFQFTLSMPFIESLEYRITSILQDKLAKSIVERSIIDFDKKSKLKNIYRAKSFVWYNLTNIIVENIFFVGTLFSLAFTLKIVLEINFIVSVLIILLGLLQNVFVLKMANDEIKMLRKQDEIKRYILYLKNTIINKSNLKEIKCYNLFDWLEEKLNNQIDNLERCNMDYLNKWFTKSFFINLISQISNAGIVITAMFFLINKKINVAQFVVLYQSRNMLIASLERIIGHITDSVKVVDYIKNVFNEIDNEVYKKKLLPPVDNNNVIEIEDLSFEYRKNEPVLKNINLKIKKGEIVLIVGENGSGKSSLIKIILGLISDYKGYVRKNYGLSSAVFQDYTKFMLSLRENIAFGDLTKISDNLKIVNALDKGDSMKIYERCNNDLDAILGNQFSVDGKELSEGQWQRVSVSRAFLGENTFIVFDEPAASLDPIAEYQQFKKIKNEFIGKTVILISHRIGLAKFADRIIFMSKGKIEEEGTHEKLLINKGGYFNFYEEQAKWYKK